MHLLSINGLSAQIDGRHLFTGVTFGLRRADRVGIVGPNGSGKSTLLRILAGELRADDSSIAVSGQITPRRAIRVAWLPQNADWSDDQAAAVVLEGVDEVSDRHEAESILTRLGIDPEQSTDTMSGGQRRRVALARVLVVPSDVLLLDEPTNHLDVESIRWLESELQTRQSAVMMVTHDRYLLERTTNRMLDLAPIGGSAIDSGSGSATTDLPSARWHEGNYSSLLEARAHAASAHRDRTHKAQVLLAKEIAWLRRQPRARGSKPKFRQQQVVALTAAADGPTDRLPLQLGTGRRRLGNDVIELHSVTCERGGATVLDAIDLTVRPGERVGIVGPNGSGKTTLLEVALGLLAPNSGEVRTGTTVQLGYYPQEASAASSGESVLDRLLGIAAHIPLANGQTLPAARLAERFGFSPRLQQTPINALSGGERRRLALLEVLIDAPNVIVMDEPTNDLDLDTLAVLEDYLDGFNGSLLIASHDRYVLDRLTDRIIAVEHGQLLEFIEFADYHAQRKAPAATPTRLDSAQRSAPPAGTTPRSTTPTSGPQAARGAGRSDREVNQLRQKARKDRRRAEERIERLTSQRDELAETMARAATEPERLLALQNDLRQLDTQVATAEQEWFAAAEVEEALDRGHH